MLNANAIPGTQTADVMSARKRANMPNNGAGCTHYWLIKEPRGPTSPGRCKLCGARATLPNTVGLNWHEQQKAEASIFQSLPYSQKVLRIKGF